MTVREQNILNKMERELNLKQLQIKSLLAITQAINENVSADGLYNMYKSFMSWEMGVEKMALFIKDDDDWRCAVHQNISDNGVIDGSITRWLMKYKRLHTIKEDDDEILRGYDIIIPVYHKETPIAYSLVGGMKDQDDVYNKIQFITTITNIIAVAIENKRLFKRQVEQEAFKREMTLAGRVQKMLIPEELPNGPRFDLDAIYRPHSNIGGDYFDIIQYSKDKFAFCIADISGKGVSAALLMANFQANMQSLIYQFRDLQTFVLALNTAVFKTTKGDKYITLFIGEIDLKNNTLQYVNAGHIPPFLKVGNEIKRLDKGTTVIGAFDKLPFVEQGEEKLDDCGLILTFTDGLTDLMDDMGQYFDEERIAGLLNNHACNSAISFNEYLLENIETFRGDNKYPDDIAVLTCRYAV